LLPRTSENIHKKLSEKSRRHPKRELTRHQNRPVRPVLAPIDGPNTRPERHSHPFSDSFLALCRLSRCISCMWRPWGPRMA